MNVNGCGNAKSSRIGSVYERVLEVILFVLVTPALIAGFDSLNHLPIV